MSLVSLKPQSIVSSSNMISSATVADIQDDPFNKDGYWIESNSSSSRWSVVVDFPTPTGVLSGTQTLNFSMRNIVKTGFGGSSQFSYYLRQNGTLIKSITSPFNATYSITFDSSELLDASGQGITVEFEGIPYVKKGTFGTDVVVCALDAMRIEASVEDAPVSDPPQVTILNIDKLVISDEPGQDRANVVFNFDTDVVAWEVRVMSTGQGTGTLAASGGAVTATFDITAEIDWSELYQEGENRIDIFGQNSDGVWTPYQP
jgi:hypothetical protein